MDEDQGPTKAAGRRVASSLARAFLVGARGRRLDQLVDGPSPDAPASPAGDYADDGHKQLVQRHLGFDADSPELGTWIEPPRNGHDEATGGKSDYVRFPRFWRTWMRRQTPEKLAALDDLAVREIEARMKRRIWRNARRTAVAVFLGLLWALHWGADQISFIKEKGPLLLEAWQWLWALILGSRG